MGDTVIIGGTSGIGRAIAADRLRRGHGVVVAGRDGERARAVAAEITAEVTAGHHPDDDAGGALPARGIAADLARPETLAAALADVETVDALVLTAAARDGNTVATYDVGRAVVATTVKLVGYVEAVHQLAPRMTDGASVLFLGGMAKDYPVPGETTASVVNAGVSGLVRALSVEIAPVRVNALHPGIVADTPHWVARPEVAERIVARSLTRRAVLTSHIVDAAAFLLDNPSANGIDLELHGGLP